MQRATDRVGARRLVLAIRLASLELRVATIIHEFERRYRPDQPRAPRGTPIGGQWVFDGGRQGDRLSGAYFRVGQAINGITDHGINQIISRGISPGALLDALQNPLKIRPRPNGTTQYIGARATVVLNEAGGLVTAWPR